MTQLSLLSVPYRAAQRSISIVFALAFFAFSGGAALGGFLGALGGILLAGLVILAIVGFEFARYQRFEYELTPDTFDIRSGVFSRRNREIPYRRIQNVDISRNIAQRLFDIAAVDLETAGGDDTEGSLHFVSYDEALRIQREVARLKRGEADEAAPEPDRDVLFELEPRELAIVGALSFDLRLPGAVLVFGSSIFPVLASFADIPIPLTGIAALLFGISLLVLLVAFIAWATGFVSAVLNYYGFRLTRVGDELQYERGLLQRYNGSIPLDKLQTLTIEDNPLKRHFGYATLYVETAGYTPGGDSSGSGRARRGSEAAIPLSRRERVVQLIEDLEGVSPPEFERPPTRIRRRYAVRNSLVLVAITLGLFAMNWVLPQAIPWYAPLILIPGAVMAGVYQWRHRGHGLTENHFVTRNGFWKRTTRFVPYYRIQTIIQRRTPFQRRWRVSTVTADTAGTLSLVGGDAAAVDIDAGDATVLQNRLNERLGDALVKRREQRQRARQAALGISTGGNHVESDVTDADDTADADTNSDVDDTANVNHNADADRTTNEPADPFVYSGPITRSDEQDGVENGENGGASDGIDDEDSDEDGDTVDSEEDQDTETGDADKSTSKPDESDDSGYDGGTSSDRR
ncbi:PH domain-containing protein [Haloferax sp. DFSO60]|uniref:PH domain-containing protein n=1 Tax=Haloferax sp. DFSO60 TaxID=3388652 RepID=UPI0039788FAB